MAAQCQYDCAPNNLNTAQRLPLIGTRKRPFKIKSGPTCNPKTYCSVARLTNALREIVSYGEMLRTFK